MAYHHMLARLKDDDISAYTIVSPFGEALVEGTTLEHLADEWIRYQHGHGRTGVYHGVPPYPYGPCSKREVEKFVSAYNRSFFVLLLPTSSD